VVEETGYENVTGAEEVVGPWSPIKLGTTVLSYYLILPDESSRISPLHPA